jgi:hypothetical protein
MKRVELDYLAPVRAPAWPGVLVLVVALVAAGALVKRYADTQDALARLEATGKLVSPERRPLPAASKERLEAEAKSAESVVRQLALPWASMIQAIEQSATREVALLQLQPDAETRSVKLTAEARSREAMFDYLRRHQVQREDPQRPIQFTLQGSLR